jgi:CBS domain containing-hemolysin-like protein
MSILFLALIGGVTLLLTVISVVQLLYLESLRLRTRDLPALSLFKDKIEAELRMETESGALTFSLVKHGLMVLLGVIVLLSIAHGRPAGWSAAVEAALGSGALVLLAVYLAPHLLYRRTSGKWLSGFVPILRLIALPGRPIAAALRFLESLVANGDETAGSDEPPTQAENIEALIEAGAEGGLIEEGDRKLIQSVVEFGDKTVREVMTPRPEIVSISVSATLDELRQLAIHEQYSRIPVYEDDIDQIVGFVHVRDMFELDDETRAQRTVRELMRSIKAVPESKLVQDLMREMQQDSTHMVIVVDEYGHTAGLASMEDLVEVILGEIRDEHEPGSDVAPDGPGAYIVAGSLDVSRLNDLFEYRPQADTESTTLGGLASEWLGRVPEAGESVARDGIRIDVLASNGMRVEKARVSRVAPPAEIEAETLAGKAVSSSHE